MLTPTDKNNMENFKRLSGGHQRTFKHRLKIKCTTAIKDIQFVLTNYEKLGIKPDKFVNIIELTNLMEQYENLCLLQNM